MTPIGYYLLILIAFNLVYLGNLPPKYFFILEQFAPPPLTLRMGILIGWHLRAKRKCSEEECFQSACRNLLQIFQPKEYPKKLLKKAYGRAKRCKRYELLSDSVSIVPLLGKIIRCIGTYDSHASEIQNILWKLGKFCGQIRTSERWLKRAQILFIEEARISETFLHTAVWPH